MSRPHPTSPTRLGRLRSGLPRLVVAPRRGFQLGRSISAGSPSLDSAGEVDGAGPDCDGRAVRAGRGLPTDGDESRPASSRPSSHAEPGRPGAAEPRAVAQVAVVGDDQERRRAVGAVERPDVVDRSARITSSAVRPPL